MVVIQIFVVYLFYFSVCLKILYKKKETHNYCSHQTNVINLNFLVESKYVLKKMTCIFLVHQQRCSKKHRNTLKLSVEIIIP